MGCALGRSGGRRHRESGQLLSINFSPQGAPRRRLPRPTDAPLELVLRTPAGSVAGLGANAPTGSGHRAEVGSWEAVRSSGEHEVVEA